MAMKLAMKEADVAPEQIDYINAHGTSTHHNDLFETKAIKFALGDAAKDVVVNSTKSMRSFATKSFTSAAICTLNSDASNFVIGPMPTLPSLIPAQNSSTVFPIGVTAPSPVTTTLLFISINLSFPKSLLNSHRHSAVYIQHLPGDIPRLIRCQECHCIRDIFYLSNFPQRDLRHSAFLYFIGNTSVISVLINPGATALTVIPLLASSLAADFVSPITPAFDAE